MEMSSTYFGSMGGGLGDGTLVEEVGDEDLGALGHPLEERIIVSHGRMFLPWHKPVLPVHTAPSLPRIRQLVDQGRYQEAGDLVVDLDAEVFIFLGDRWFIQFKCIMKGSDCQLSIFGVNDTGDFDL
jgi:hypothetical protein